MATTRGLLYTLARLMGDVSAVQKGTVGKRIGRRIVGKMTGAQHRETVPVTTIAGEPAQKQGVRQRAPAFWLSIPERYAALEKE